MALKQVRRSRVERFDTEWKQHAACNPRHLGQPDRGLDFIGVDDTFTPRERFDNTRRCLAICATCPVIDECGEYADAAGMQWGMWGGQPPRSTKCR